jgi:ribosome biogenesis GTPase / thiamine phosphate phosphatase
MNNEQLVDGWIIRLQSGFYTVQTSNGTITCQMRGRLKRERATGDVISVGDHVSVLALSDGTGRIESIEPRQRALIRMDPRPKGEYRQILLANIDQIVLVFSCANPEPRLRMLDRFLVIAEKQGIPAVVVANKVDLVGKKVAREIFNVYADLGYPTIYTSAQSGLGLTALKTMLENRISGLAGPSGVGKSTLLNAIQPELGLAVREVSELTDKGKHTTVVRQMFPLHAGGFVADLPGLKSLALWDTQPEELDGYFPELRDLVWQCSFNDCTHTDEPRCAVTAAVEKGTIDIRRYESYVRMRFGGDNYGV